MGGRNPLPGARPLGLGLALASIVLWGFAGWTWWIVVPLVIGLGVVRMATLLFPPDWRGWSGPALALLVVLYLLTLTTVRAAAVAFGLVALSVAWALRWASPKWTRWIALGLGLAMVGGGITAEFVVWANTREQRAQDAQVEREYQVAKLRPPGGVAMVYALVRAIAEDNVDHACWLFSPTAAAQFAVAHGAADCPAVVHALSAQVVGSRNRYAEAVIPFADATHPDKAGVVRVTGCRLAIQRGFETTPAVPTLGQMRLETDPRYPAAGYLITGYAKCGDPAPEATAPGPLGPSTSTTAPTASSSTSSPAPTTTTTRPGPAVLPTYPPQFATILVKAIAAGDTGGCGYFTDQGKQQFAAAHGAADCPAAIRALAAKVTDPELYGQPSAATHTGTAGRPVVEACRLVWQRFGQKPRVPGPQPGRLTLTSPDGRGYLIDGYRRC